MINFRGFHGLFTNALRNNKFFISNQKANKDLYRNFLFIVELLGVDRKADQK
jgi:hypothetical protein